mmetsp:Transcript_36244/g.71305  ORF Transcript_36244/g.71305 Transcript_36244/m.71305 type:complete len:84 (-) Transcript_36244:468-719(-)
MEACEEERRNDEKKRDRDTDKLRQRDTLHAHPDETNKGTRGDRQRLAVSSFVFPSCSLIIPSVSTPTESLPLKGNAGMRRDPP